jgi:hypothetical protein
MSGSGLGILVAMFFRWLARRWRRKRLFIDCRKRGDTRRKVSDISRWLWILIRTNYLAPYSEIDALLTARA